MGAHAGIPFISVIIPSGRPRRVKHTIACLLRQTLPSSHYEIIVVIPDPAAASRPLKAAVHIIGAGRLYPPGKMRNLGAEAAAGGYLAFIDDDCLPPPEWLFRMVQALDQDERNGAVGCRVVSSDGDFWSRCADFALFADYQYRQPRRCNLGSAALCVRRAAFEAAGGFDEDLKASEDWDFSLKLQARGWRCIFEPAVAVLHDHRRDNPAKILKSAYRSGKFSGLCIQRRHFEKMSWLARVSLHAKDRHLYALMVFPYAAAVTLQQFFHLQYGGSGAAFPPFVFLSKVAFHIGVLSSDEDRLAGRPWGW